MTERTAALAGSSRLPRRRSLLVLVALALAALGLQSTSGTANAATTWAPASSAPIHPGVQTETTGSGQCTSNFVFQDAAGTYLGQAAHCAGLGEATDTNGCQAESLPLGTTVEIQGATQPGTLVYSSWLTMQAKGETDASTCAYNDFALVKVHPDDVARINPSVPHWGGPTAVGGATSFGAQVYSYGNSSLRLGLTVLSPKVGLSLGTSGGGWSHDVYTITPGIPGDSGSGFMDAKGRAFGTLSTLALLPLPASNGVGDLARELNYLRANSAFTALALVPGTQPFRPGLPI